MSVIPLLILVSFFFASFNFNLPVLHMLPVSMPRTVLWEFKFATINNPSPIYGSISNLNRSFIEQLNTVCTRLRH